jgi:chromosome segregation ATPase
MTTENRELTIVDRIAKDLVPSDGSAVKVPLSSVFGKGPLAKVESFGGRSLVENAERTDQAIEEMKPLHNIWNHSHSQWDWKHITLSWYSDYGNMKQIEAEMQRKRAALNDVKWRMIKNEIKMKKLEEELASLDPEKDYWRIIDLKVKITEHREGIAEGTIMVEGAMKDVLALKDLYDSLRERVANFTEEDFEKEESKSHLKRSVSQCLRDIRQFGSITKGEQEYLEQIGVNPGKALVLFRKYVEAQDDAWDNTNLIKFIEDFVDDMIDNHKVDYKRILTMGFRTEAIPELGYTKPVAIKED